MAACSPPEGLSQSNKSQMGAPNAQFSSFLPQTPIRTAPDHPAPCPRLSGLGCPLPDPWSSWMRGETETKGGGSDQAA